MPITATRLPVRSTEWSHSAEWKEGPRKLSRPGISGNDGTCSAPTPETTAFVVNVSPSVVLTRQWPASSYSRPVTSRPNRKWGVRPYVVAQARR